MKTIPLTQGTFALVDDGDYNNLSMFKWTKCQNYAGRTIGKRGNQKRLLMHRVILDAPSDMYVDHINGNTFDNRRSNLRLASPWQNAQNRGMVPSTNKSGYRGVYFSKQKYKWGAVIKVNRKIYHIGFFDDRNEAATAYNLKGYELAGEYFKPNIIVDESLLPHFDLPIKEKHSRKLKEYCIRGHKYDVSNTIYRNRGDRNGRECRKCVRQLAKIARIKRLKAK